MVDLLNDLVQSGSRSVASPKSAYGMFRHVPAALDMQSGGVGNNPWRAKTERKQCFGSRNPTCWLRSMGKCEITWHVENESNQVTLIRTSTSHHMNFKVKSWSASICPTISYNLLSVIRSYHSGSLHEYLQCLVTKLTVKPLKTNMFTSSCVSYISIISEF